MTPTKQTTTRPDEPTIATTTSGMVILASLEVYNRLQRLSCEHAFRLWVSSGRPKRRIYVHEDIRENCKILGRGSNEEIKARVLWYLTFQPDVFDTCSKNQWR